MKNLLAVAIGIVCIAAYFLVVGNNQKDSGEYNEEIHIEEEVVYEMVETDVSESFQGVNISGPFEVVLIQGDHSDLDIQADSKTAPHIKSEVKNGVLKIWMDKKVRNADDIKLTITNPVFEQIDVHGAAEIHSGNILRSESLDMDVSGACEVEMEMEVAAFEANVSGAGDLDLTGSASNIEISISGAGNIEAADLEADRVEISISGAGHAQVHANEELDVSISGVGSVSYAGEPGTIKKRISGMGSLSKM